MNAKDLIALIYKRYEGNAYVVLEQVPDGTGMMHSGWIDAAVFSLWPSKGLTRSAFEVKVSRSDFVTELQNPQKHKWVQESFHEFWFIAPQNIIQVDELPVGAGFMYPHGDNLCIKKYCTRNDSPKLDDVLLAGFMRAAWKAIEKNKKITIDEVLLNSKTYQMYETCADAVSLFCQSHGSTLFFEESMTKEEIVKHLEGATQNRQLKEDRDHLLDITAQFQRKIVDLFRLFAVVANCSLLARDEFGKYITSTFGGNDSECLEVLKSHKQSDYTKRYIEWLDLLLNWQKEEEKG